MKSLTIKKGFERQGLVEPDSFMEIFLHRGDPFDDKDMMHFFEIATFSLFHRKAKLFAYLHCITLSECSATGKYIKGFMRSPLMSVMTILTKGNCCDCRYSQLL